MAEQGILPLDWLACPCLGGADASRLSLGLMQPPAARARMKAAGHRFFRLTGTHARTRLDRLRRVLSLGWSDSNGGRDKGRQAMRLWTEVRPGRLRLGPPLHAQ